ncbi:MAG: AhpC/TSA family protein [Acidobacteria bacterium]|nr:AhpC/TSA family protein [Acidobacteriota bacterium]
MKTLFLLFASLTTLVAAPPAVGERAPAFTLNNLKGEPRRLADSTAQGPVVLLVLRGFPGYQCPLCNRQVTDFVKNGPAFAAAGVRVVMVYPGPKSIVEEKAREFVTGKALPDHFELLVDPDYEMTNLYQLRWNAPNETAYPSTFVIDRQGVVKFARISTSHGGRTTAAEVLSQLPR